MFSDFRVLVVTGLPQTGLRLGLLPSERVWAISIARLNALLRVHLRPIDVIVSDGPCVEILS